MSIPILIPPAKAIGIPRQGPPRRARGMSLPGTIHPGPQGPASIAVACMGDYIVRLMKIVLQDLHRGLAALQRTAEPGELGLDGERFIAPVQASVRLERLGDGWLARLDLAFRVHRVCDRCLADVDLDQTAEERCLILPVGQRPSEDDEDRVLLFEPDQDEVDISPVVRDALALSQPEYFLCRDDCKGLCPLCGEDRNQSDCGCRPPAPGSPFGALAALRDPESTN